MILLCWPKSINLDNDISRWKNLLKSSVFKPDQAQRVQRDCVFSCQAETICVIMMIDNDGGNFFADNDIHDDTGRVPAWLEKLVGWGTRLWWWYWPSWSGVGWALELGGSLDKPVNMMMMTTMMMIVTKKYNITSSSQQRFSPPVGTCTFLSLFEFSKSHY